MPWTAVDVPRFNKQLSAEQTRLWVSTANRVLADCKARKGTDCDGKAVRVANGAVREHEVMKLVDEGYLLEEALGMIDYILWGTLV